MLEEYLQPLDTIIDERHYLKRDTPQLPQYRQSYAKNARFLIDKLTPKQQRDLLQNKLDLWRNFDPAQEKKFIQAACETTVTSYFAKHFADTYKYEPRLNGSNKANVECQFEALNYKYNIEVKCPTFNQQEAQDLGNRFHFNLTARTDNRELIDGLLKGLNEVTDAEGLPNYVIPHRMDNTLGDYLVSANKKFAEASSESNVNILVVCCGDAKNIQEFFNYLFQSGGFFNEYPDPAILPVAEYKFVDVVILCNLYHRHHNYFTKPGINDNWNFFHSFNLIFDNLNREILDEKADGIDFLREYLLPNYTHELFEFINTKMGGFDLPHEFLEAIGVEQYITDQAKRGISHF